MSEVQPSQKRVQIYRFPKLDLSGDSDVSNYVRICDLFSKMITEKALTDGETLPGENVFAAYFNTSRATIRRAFRHLEEDGFLIKRQGKGTIVSFSAFSDQKLIQWCHNLGYENCTRPITDVGLEIEPELSGEFLSGKLNLTIGTKITVFYLSFFSERELVGNCVLIIPDSFLASRLPGPRSKDETLSFLLDGIYKYIRMTETSIQVLSVGDEKDHRIPVLREKVVLNVQEFLFDSNCAPVGLCNYYLRSDCYRFPLSRKAKGDPER